MEGKKIMMDDLLSELNNKFNQYYITNLDQVVVQSELPLKEKESKYNTDIESLKSYFGDRFCAGVELEIELAKILELCPRKRRRVEAYQGLLSRLMKMNIEVKINSKKKKL